MISKILNFLFSKETFSLSSMQIIKDLFIFPRIFIIRLNRFGLNLDFFKVKKIINYVQKKKSTNSCRINFQEFKNSTDFYEISSNILNKYGILIVEKCFSEDEVKSFLEFNSKILPEKNFANNENVSYINSLKSEIPLKNNLFLFDDRIIKIIEYSLINSKNKKKYLFVRQPSTVSFFSPRKNNLDTNWTAGWHVDFPTQFTTHVLLDDLNENQTRMQAIPFSKNLLLIPGKHYSINYKNLNDIILNCTGPKGTLYIHSGNTLHRNYPVIDQNRFLWGQIYTMDEAYYTIDTKQKNEILSDSKEFYENLSNKNKSKIDNLLQSPNYLRKQDSHYFKVVKNKILKANKKDFTYLKF